MDQLFIDANILFTASFSKTGASRWLFRLAEKEKLILVTSLYAVQEAKVNIEKKLEQQSLLEFYKLLATFKAIEKKKYSEEQEKLYSNILPAKDIPILLSALSQKANFLITLDKKDFLSEEMKTDNIPVKVTTPGEYLKIRT